MLFSCAGSLLALASLNGKAQSTPAGDSQSLQPPIRIPLDSKYGTQGMSGAAPGQNQLSISSCVAAGLLVQKVDAIYPPIAKAAHIQGTVVLQGLIGKDGTVRELHVLNGHPMLQQAAIDAVRQWHYRPYLLKGEPVEVLTTINVIFSLDAPPPAAPAALSGAPTYLPRQINISSGVAQGSLQFKVAPVYPPDAKAAGVSGTVVLQCTISKEGRVVNLNVVSGPALLQQSAIDAVRQWRYRPYLVNGEAVEVQTTVNLIFTLGG
jgi:TonB family protein